MRFLFVDRITAISEGKSIRGFKNISWDGDFLEEIFQGLPVVSPVIVAEAAAQLVSWLIIKTTQFKTKPVITVVDSYRCHRHIMPGGRVEMEGHIESLHEDSALVHTGIFHHGTQAIELNHAVAYFYPLAELENPSKVKRQFDSLLEKQMSKASPLHCPTLAKYRIREEIPITRHVFVDRIIGIEGTKRITGIKNVTSTEGYFDDHFPLKPVLPGVITMEAIISLARILIERALAENGLQSQRPVLHSCSKIKFRKFVKPGDQLIMDVTMESFNDHISIARGKARTGEKNIVANLSMEFAHLNEKEYQERYLFL